MYLAGKSVLGLDDEGEDQMGFGTYLMKKGRCCFSLLHFFVVLV